MEPPVRALALDHVGIAAADQYGLPLLTLLGTGELAAHEMPSGVSVARFGPEQRLELVVPARPGSPIQRFLERRGAGLHHVALSVSEPLDELVARLDRLGYSATGLVEPAADGRPSVFLHPTTTGGILIELLEAR